METLECSLERKTEFSIGIFFQVWENVFGLVDIQCLEIYISKILSKCLKLKEEKTILLQF